MHRFAIPVCRYSLVACYVLFVVGCGGSDQPELVPVSGKVTLEGVPVSGASVLFQPDAGGRPGTGVTDENGIYHISSYGQPKDGTVAGVHKVAVIKIGGEGASALAQAAPNQADPNALSEMAAPDPNAKAAAPKIDYLVPQRYGDANTSGLKLTVPDGGGDDINLELTLM